MLELKQRSIRLVNDSGLLMGENMSDRFCITVQHVIDLLRTRPIQKWDLPEERITPGRPFQNTGIDFGGPFKTKAKPSSKIIDKTYMCLRLLHHEGYPEAVSSLIKEACIASLKRFVARRGAPEVIFSDNATNFLGARNDLLKLNDILAGREDESLAHYATMHGMNWVMIPPRAPNFGGLWEAGVKSAKHHLRRVMGNTTLTM